MVFLAGECSSQTTLLPHSMTSGHTETWAEPCNPTESSHDKAGVVKGQRQGICLCTAGDTEGY